MSKLCVCSLNEHGVECNGNFTFRCVLLLLDVFFYLLDVYNFY